MERTASAVWKGGLKDGQGTVSTASRALADTPYSFKDRFESGTGTNPEELVAAAHAGCFSMALSAELGNANLKPESIRTTAKLTFEKKPEGFRLALPSSAESAIEKQPAWAAATSSSGLVPVPDSKRSLNE